MPLALEEVFGTPSPAFTAEAEAEDRWCPQNRATDSSWPGTNSRFGHGPYSKNCHHLGTKNAGREPE